MGTHVPSAGYPEPYTEPPRTNRESHSSGVSWGAVVAGAFVAAALYLLLLALGAGFGLSVISPWSSASAAHTLSEVALVWLILIEIAASAFGGYLTGRLRTKWAQVHTDEVFFRDTANGFLAWAVALVVSVAFLASAGAYMAGSAERNATSANGANAAMADNPRLYFADELFRSDRSAADAAADAAIKGEAIRILMNGIEHNQLAAADQSYLARTVATRTGISEPEAEQRVSTVFTQVQQAEDAARKATARILLWSFLALVMGAFSASYAATIGGRQRDLAKSV